MIINVNIHPFDDSGTIRVVVEHCEKGPLVTAHGQSVEGALLLAVQRLGLKYVHQTRDDDE